MCTNFCINLKKGAAPYGTALFLSLNSRFSGTVESAVVDLTGNDDRIQSLACRLRTFTVTGTNLFNGYACDFRGDSSSSKEVFHERSLLQIYSQKHSKDRRNFSKSLSAVGKQKKYNLDAKNSNLMALCDVAAEYRRDVI